ncbi:MAG: metal ABC transporter permease, partial [Planctomycetota bacterium]
MPGLEYNTRIVLAGTMTLGLAAGVIGSLALLRRRALLGDALSHATLPGVCLAFMLAGELRFELLLLGALVTGALGVVAVALITRHTRVREDAAIGIVLSVFFGAGIALSGIIQKRFTNAAQAGIDSFLLGRTAGIVQSDVLLIAGVAGALLLVVILFYKELKLLCFDPEFAAVDGWPVTRLDLLLMLLLAVTTVIGLPAVGVVLMVALLILPAAAARFWVEGLSAMLILAGSLGMATGAAGTLVSARADDLPAGPVIVLAGSALFLLSLLLGPRRGLIARTVMHLRERRASERKRLLRTVYEASEERLPERRWIPVSELLASRSWSSPRLRGLLARARRTAATEE